MTDCCTDKRAAQALGIVFLLVMALGFIPNPLVSPTGLFAVNAAHNIVHGVIGIALLLAAHLGRSKQALLAFGCVYVLLAIYGYLTMMNGGMMLGMVMVNMADHYLHLALGIVLIVVGLLAKPAGVKGK